MIKLSQLRPLKINFVIGLLVALVTTGCKKGNIIPVNKVYLPIQVKYMGPLDHNVANYQYDALNRLIDVSSVDTGGFTPYSTTLSTTSGETKYTYDNANRVTQAVVYFNGALAGTTTYTYSAGSISVKVVSASGIFYYTLTLDNNNRIISLTDPGDFQSYTYDSAGNTISYSDIYNALSTTTPQIVMTYSYDNQRGCFSNVVGNSAMGSEGKAENNIAGYLVTYPLQPSDSFTVSNKYTYNADGYPTNCIATVVTNKTTTSYTTTYTYLVR